VCRRAASRIAHDARMLQSRRIDRSQQVVGSIYVERRDGVLGHAVTKMMPVLAWVQSWPVWPANTGIRCRETAGR
jgi:hypothetical protein